MSQNDFTIANQGFPAFRADLNSALQALASNNSGATEPTTMFANMWWYDTSNNIMYIRNEDNDAWIKFAELDQANDKFVLSGTLQLDDGTVSAPALTFNSDTNMGIYRGGTDILKFVTAGTDAITIDASQQTTFAGNIDVTGTVTADGLALATASDITFGSSSVGIQGNASGADYIKFTTNSNERLNIASTGDISFYEDTGTTPKMVWKASEERLGIGIATPGVPLHVKGTTDTNVMIVDATGTSPNYIFDVRDDGTSKFRVDPSGNVGIGADSPNNLLHVNGGATDTAFQITNSATGSSATDGFSIIVENPTPDVVIRNRESSNIRFLTSNSERMRILSTGGITFNGDTATANALDDYEEGTFTPTYTASGGGSVTMVATTGKYVKVGKIVHIQIRMLTSAESLSGDITVTGLPFTSHSTVNHQTVLSCQGARFATDMPNLRAFISHNTTVITLEKSATTAVSGSYVTDADMINSTNYNVLKIAGSYEVS